MNSIIDGIISMVIIIVAIFGAAVFLFIGNRLLSSIVGFIKWQCFRLKKDDFDDYSDREDDEDEDEL